MYKRVFAILAAVGALAATALIAQQVGAQPATCRPFAATGHSVCGAFLTYWDTHGGLEQQGYPISEPFSEISPLDGKAYTVQYFERAVFERHPENAPPYDVLLAQLGTYQYGQKYPAGASTPGATPAGDVWATLAAKPLALPTVASGTCPTTVGRPVAPTFGLAIGDGPFYPVGLGTDATLHYGGAAFPAPWLGQKVLWIGDGAYSGPVLVRGRRLDGAGEVHFGPGADPGPELRLDPASNVNSAAGWHDWPAYTRVRVAGCYAYQVDGLGFRQVIVFTAAP